MSKLGSMEVFDGDVLLDASPLRVFSSASISHPAGLSIFGLYPLQEQNMAITFVDEQTLKRLKNSVVGNASAKASLAADSSLLQM
jgi:hypothetical protein